MVHAERLTFKFVTENDTSSLFDVFKVWNQRADESLGMFYSGSPHGGPINYGWSEFLIEVQLKPFSFLIAKIGNEPVGYIQLYEKKYGKNQKSWHTVATHVIPSRRMEGVAKKLSHKLTVLASWKRIKLIRRITQPPAMAAIAESMQQQPLKTLKGREKWVAVVHDSRHKRHLQTVEKDVYIRPRRRRSK